MTAVVYRWELRKLVAQKRTYAGLIAATIFALAFVLVLRFKHGAAVPTDIPLGAQVKQTGLALPLVLLQFASIFGAPLITALVASDIVATEHQNSTLKTVLTRSVTRGQLFAGKAFAAATYAVAVIATCGIVSFVGASLAFGLHPLRDVAGNAHAVGHALALVLAGYGVYLLPAFVVCAFAFFLSVVSRNGAAALIGALLYALAFQLVAALPGIGGVKRYLLPDQWQAWQAIFNAPGHAGAPVRAIWVCAVYIAVPLLVAWLVFRRRDVAGD
jgi:ABC-2 type transport system permease protein